jgi:uncharacterized delta-60 repeat protein
MPRQHSWIKKLFRRAPRTRGRRPRLQVEALEDRTVPASGDLDPTFGNGGKVLTPFDFTADIAEAVAVQADGKIVAVGSSFSSATGDDFALARYNADGSLDTSFSGDGLLITDFAGSGDIATSVAIQADGKIIVAGYSGQVGSGRTVFALARYNADGSLDTSFSGDGQLTMDFGSWDDLANSVAIQADGKIVVAGWSSLIDGSVDFALARYNADGSLDTSFSGDGRLITDFGATTDIAVSVAIQADGKIVAAGTSLQSATEVDFAVARYNADGSLDTSFRGDGRLTTDFGTAGDDFANSVAIQADGKIVVAGESSPSGIWNDFALARYNVDGSLDTSFSGDGRLTTGLGTKDDSAYSVAIQADGKIVAAGWSEQSGTWLDFALARYNVDGSLDTSFSGDGWVTTDFGGANEFAFSVAIQKDGKIVAAGVSDALGRNTFALARYLNSQPPIAHAGGPYAIYVGDSLTLDASQSSDPDGDTLTYSWDVNGDADFGDATGVNATLTWAQLRALGIDARATPFNVQVRVNDGQSTPVDSPTTTLTVTATTPGYTPPVGLQSGNTNANTTFNLGSFADVLAAGPWTIDVAWGDGTSETFSAAGPGALSRAHAYTSLGLYTATVTLTNSYGNSSAGSFQIVAGTYVINTSDSGPGSLRQALLYSNASVGVVDTVHFAIGSGVKTVVPLSALPTITDAVILDATTQPGYAGTPIIELNGISAGPSTTGLTITSGGTTIRGLVINRFGGHGILITGSGATDNVMVGNYIGTNVAGTSGLGNSGYGVHVLNSKNTTIGGSSAAARNVISGNGFSGVSIQGSAAFGNLVQGNYIGTNASGSAAIGNRHHGVDVYGGASDTVIGTDGDGQNDANEGNVIAGSTWDGITTWFGGAPNLVVAGNLVGTDATGKYALPNGLNGITLITDMVGACVGTNADGVSDELERNVFSGNGRYGVMFWGSGSTQHVIAGNYIGTDLTGLFALGNADDGVHIEGGANGNTIGGNTTAARNIISGNNGDGVEITGAGTNNNVVAGNYIGTNDAGNATIPNGHGIAVNGGAANTLIGGGTAGTGNLLSGNRFGGIANDGAVSTVIAGNYIGLNAAGTAALPNSVGIYCGWGSTDTRIGTNGDGINDAGERNVISGNPVGSMYIQGVGTMRTVVAGNYIGTNAAGDAAIVGGMVVQNGATNTRIGTDGSNDPFNVNERNVISSNALEISVSHSGTTGTVIAGNYIGINAAGTATINTGNIAVLVWYGASDSRIGTNGDGIADVEERNVISIRDGSGVFLTNRYWDGSSAPTTRNVIAGNYLGTDATGTIALGMGPNAAGTGVSFWDGASGNRVGTDGNGVGDLAERNLISGNGDWGVIIANPGSDSNIIAGNYIGTDASGTAAVANGAQGIWIVNGPKNNVIGTNGDGVGDAVEGNLISGNGPQGVLVTGVGSDGNVIAGNMIGTSAAGTTALGNLDGIWIGAGARFNRVGTNADGVSDALERNVISGNRRIGIVLSDAGTDSNVVAGNFVGLNAAGTSAVPNRQFAGIWLQAGARNNRIGTNADGIRDSIERNVISGNAADGLVLVSSGTTGNIVAGNFIGTDSTGALELGNLLNGVKIYAGASNNTVGGTAAGAGNIIAHNGGAGVLILDSGSTGNQIRGNSIHSNGGLGIDLGGNGVTLNDAGDGDTGPNALINFPVVTSATNGAATLVSGTFESAGTGPFTLEFFASTTPDGSSHGEGSRFIGATTVASAGGFNATLSATSTGEWITATVTDAQGNTSEFSLAFLTNNPPVASAGGPYAINEGDGLNLDASATSDADGDSLLYSWDVNGDGVFGDATGVGPTLTWGDLVALGINDGTRNFGPRVRVDDQHGGVTTSSAAALTVANTAPVAGLTVPTQAVRQQSRLFTLTAADLSPVDQAASFTFQIDWDGNGSIDETLTGPSGLEVTHIFPLARTYTIIVTARDKDGGTSAPVSQSLRVAVAQMQGDDLAIGGTITSDRFALTLGAANGVIAVLNGRNVGTFTVPGNINLFAAGGIDLLTLNGSPVADAFDVAATTVTRGSRVITGSSIESRVLNGKGGDDTFTLTSDLPANTGLALSGNAGTDTLVAPASGDHLWLINDPNAGTLDNRAFTGIDSLVGGEAADSFVFQEDASVGGVVDGGGGTDLVDYSSADTRIIINLATGTASKTGGIAGIEQFFGGTADRDRLTGPAGPNTWRIDEADGGTIDTTDGTLTYYGFEDLIGGASADRFVLAEEGSVSRALSGGGGNDTLDYSERSSAVAVSLAAGTATGVGAGGVIGITSVIGGAGNDTLTGNELNNLLAGGAGDDILNGGAGRDLLIGGSGADDLTGGTGTGEDLLIGGIAAYYFDSPNALDLSALTAVMLEWTRTDLAAAARVEHLTGAVAGGFNGDYLLGPDTVFDDAVADRVEGGNGADWLLASLTGLVPDNLINPQTGDIVTDIP